jgi:Flp pilus assembly protein TadG
MRFPSPRATKRRGSILVLVAISLIALVAIAGLAVDGGMVIHFRRQAQQAADAGAMAAAMDLSQGQSVADATASADYYARQNINLGNTSGNTVTVNIPPTSGANVGKAGYVEVRPSKTISTSFISLVYAAAAVAKGRSVAGSVTSPASGNTLMLLHPTADKAHRASRQAVRKIGGVVDRTDVGWQRTGREIEPLDRGVDFGLVLEAAILLGRGARCSNARDHDQGDDAQDRDHGEQFQEGKARPLLTREHVLLLVAVCGGELWAPVFGPQGWL